jgi:hypothetical protein
MADADFGYDVITLVATVLAASSFVDEGPVPQHDSILTGQLYYAELLATRNTNRFINVARMDKPTFLSLLDLLTTQGGLENSMFLTAGEISGRPIVKYLRGFNTADLQYLFPYMKFQRAFSHVSSTYSRCQKKVMLSKIT